MRGTKPHKQRVIFDWSPHNQTEDVAATRIANPVVVGVFLVR